MTGPYPVVTASAIRCTWNASASLLGSDSHTPSAGALGMLAMGAGDLKVAMAMAGEPFYLRMPQITGVSLTGKLPDWVSAKDVILKMVLQGSLITVIRKKSG